MTLVVNAKNYTADSFRSDAVGYIGTAHTMSVKDTVKLSRVAPKPIVTFSGVGKTDAKLTRTLALTGALTPTWDAIVDVSVTVPVGFTPADVDTMLNDFGAFVASATFKTHVKNQAISF